MATVAKIAKDKKLAEAKKAGKAALPAPQPLLALRAAARLHAEVPACAGFASASWRWPGRYPA
jgi:hypothetical protein